MPPMLSARWTFDAASVKVRDDGQRVVMAADGGVDMVLDDAVDVVSGRYGEALRFDGSARATVPAMPQLMLSAELGYTLAMYLSVAEGPTGNWRAVLYKAVGAADSRGFGIWLYPDGMRFRAQLFTAKGPELADSRTQLPLGEWTHVAVVVDPDEIYLYVDGEFEVGTPIGHAVVTTAGPLYLGGDPTGLSFAGRIDDLRLYASPLSAADVRQLAAG